MRIKKNWPVFAANGNPVDGSQSALSHGQSALLRVSWNHGKFRVKKSRGESL
jgi:hypothetical protein